MGKTNENLYCRRMILEVSSERQDFRGGKIFATIESAGYWPSALLDGKNCVLLRWNQICRAHCIFRLEKLIGSCA